MLITGKAAMIGLTVQTGAAQTSSKVDKAGNWVCLETCSFGPNAGHGEVLIHDARVPEHRD
jgi:hypothetical protein